MAQYRTLPAEMLAVVIVPIAVALFLLRASRLRPVVALASNSAIISRRRLPQLRLTRMLSEIGCELYAAMRCNLE